MLDTVLSYEDWRDFFTKKLINTRFFNLSNTFSKGHTDVEVYSALKDDPGTTIQVGYFSSMTMIYIYIFNPKTPGNNSRLVLVYLYKYEFDPVKQYGPPGLEFTEINVQGISNFLNEGFNGLETVYYRQNKPIKSRLTIRDDADRPGVTVTYQFNEESVLKRLFKRFFRAKDEYDEIRNIDLRNIFGGLKNG